MGRRIPVIDGKKVCKDCGENKPIEEFSTRVKEDRTTHRSECKKCQIVYLNEWHAKNPDANSFWYRKKLGVNRQIFGEMLERQGGKCAICGIVPQRRFRGDTFHVDHDPETGKVRGLLCGNCNKGLGCFQDSQTALCAASEYLHDHQTEDRLVAAVKEGG